MPRAATACVGNDGTLRFLPAFPQRIDLASVHGRPAAALLVFLPRSASSLASVPAIVFQCRIISAKTSFASSRLANLQASDGSPPTTSGRHSLGTTVSGPAIRAAKNPSSSSTFIALPPLQLFRKSRRRSSSASVRGSDLAKTVIAIFELLCLLLYDTTPCCPSLRRLVSNPEYRFCGGSLCTAMASAFFCPTRTTSFFPR